MPNISFKIIIIAAGLAATTGLYKGYGQAPVDTAMVTTELIDSTALSDTITNSETDTLTKKPREQAITDPVKYSARDSNIISIREKKVYLYGDAVVTYQNIELKADYIEFDMANNQVYAYGLPDSSGVITGNPEFKQGEETFKSKSIVYNFETKKGYIKEVITEQEGGFLHGETTKRQADGHIHLKKGKYTTCDQEHPHFYIGLSKAIAIPDEKIVSGPAYMVIEDIPMPVMIPFGFFPSSKTRSSGILIPAYGEEVLRGFFLRDGGFYWAVNDYLDAIITADVYSRGTWGTNLRTNYKNRYKYSGNLETRYYENISGDKGIDYTKSKDFAIRWNHRQDPKANPYQTFSANVNFSSSSFDANHSYNMQEYLTNQKTSSISFSKSWPTRPFNFTGSFNHSQSSVNKSVDLKLPSLNFSMNRVYPFRRKEPEGKLRWYENFQINYTASLDNNLHTTDSTLFNGTTFRDFENGFKHSLPFSTTIKVLKKITITPSLTYNGVLYTSQLRKGWDADYYEETARDTIRGRVVNDTIYGMSYAQSILPSIGASYSPKIYGMYQIKNSRVQAIRHVITPSASASFTPDVRELMPEYYRTLRYFDEDKQDTVSTDYSIYDSYIYGTPMPNGKSGRLSLALRNNLEMKRLARNDTTGKATKTKILENFDFSTSYDPFKDSVRWSPVSFNTGTNLFKGLLDIKFNASFNPYAVNSRGSNTNTFLWEKEHKIARLQSASASAGLRLKSAVAKTKAGGEEQEEDLAAPDADFTDDINRRDNLTASAGYVDFDVPWSANLTYNWSYSNRFDTKTQSFKGEMTQSFRGSGDLSLTKKWKVGFSSGYDFSTKQFTMTSINISRDLHCWQMSLNVVPFGNRKSYSFQLNVKSSILQDLKLDKKRNWRDNY